MADYNLFKKESEIHCVCVDVCVSVRVWLFFFFYALLDFKKHRLCSVFPLGIKNTTTIKRWVLSL